MGLRSRNKRRRKAAGAAGSQPTTSRLAAGGADLISRLDDDVLLRVLELLSDPTDSVLTAVVSRRWCGLWARVPALRFSFDSSRRGRNKTANDAGRFVAAVDGHLSLRRAAARDAETAVKRVSILFDVSYLLKPDDPDPDAAGAGPAVSSSAVVIRAAQGWIRHALRDAVKSFVLELHLPWGYNFDNDDELIVLDNHLPATKLETMHLALSGARLQLPATAAFSAAYASLTDVSLESISLASGINSDDLLAGFLSTASCPRLQKLRLRKLVGLHELLLDAGELRDLSLEEMESGCSLELRTPSLRSLRFLDCYDRPGKLTISAPRLVELMFLKERPDRLVVHGELPRVESLKVDLIWHGRLTDNDARTNDVSLCLLQCCTSVRNLEASLYFGEGGDQVVARTPRLPHVTSLTVRLFTKLHSFGLALEEILKRYSNLKYLRVRCPVRVKSGLESYNVCEHSDRWKLHEMSLSHLREVEFVGLAGIDWGTLVRAIRDQKRHTTSKGHCTFQQRVHGKA